MSLVQHPQALASMPLTHRCVSVLCHRVNALAGSGKSFTLRLLQLIHADKTIL